MPGDSTLVTSINDTISLSDSLAHQLSANSGKSAPAAGDNGTMVEIFVFALIIVLPFLVARLRNKYKQKRAFKAAEEALETNFTQYDESLSLNNGYYRSLPPDLRRRFLERVVKFASTKTFNCVNLPMEDRMPLLIGAAAVQISFGLDKYLLDFFDTIYIMQHDYRYGVFDQPFEGHVNSNGIYLSWDNFLRGFQDYTDADNVGIHEMSHALAYVNFMAGANDGQDDNFIKRFYYFSAVARPIFNEMQNGKTNLLNAYAGSNYNEFWAVSVETFFEKSLQMQLEMPDLYNALCNLLNQDPLSPEKLLHIPEVLF